MHSPMDEVLVCGIIARCWASLEEAHLWGLVLGVGLTLASSRGLDFLSTMT